MFRRFTVTIRTTFLTCSHAARTAIAAREVAPRWDDPSVLEHMSVADLAGHLARGVFTVRQYLAGPPPHGDATVTPGEYFAHTPLTSDVDDELNTQIRERARAEASEGHAALLTRLDDAIERITEALSHEPGTRTVAVIGGTVMLLDDYLVARVVELVVHLDDLAVTLGTDAAIPADALDVALGCLLDVARARHGDIAVLRALARRERAAADVFPVF